MKNKKEGKIKARDYYDQGAREYIEMYQKHYTEYPANLIRIRFIIDILKRRKAKTVLDAGCGTCAPMLMLMQEGLDVRGFDFSRDMVREGKKVLEKSGYDPDLIYRADLEDGKSLPKEKYDSVLALGVFPHIVHERRALSNMGDRLNPGGSVFIEFRNDLFAAYTLNKYSLDFFLNRIIDMDSLPRKVRAEVMDFYSAKLGTGMAARKEKGRIKYGDILANFHNPLTIGDELFKPCGFSVAKIHFYHYHALPPAFEGKYPELFRRLSLKMERADDWRGHLMASAFVVEAKKDVGPAPENI